MRVNVSEPPSMQKMHGRCNSRCACRNVKGVHGRTAGWLTGGQVKGGVVRRAHDALVGHLALQGDSGSSVSGTTGPVVQHNCPPVPGREHLAWAAAVLEGCTNALAKTAAADGDVWPRLLQQLLMAGVQASTSSSSYLEHSSLACMTARHTAERKRSGAAQGAVVCPFWPS